MNDNFYVSERKFERLELLVATMAKKQKDLEKRVEDLTKIIIATRGTR